MDRTQLTDKQIKLAIMHVCDALYKRLAQKGNGTFSSSHEILGSITEEYIEFAEAVHNKGFDEKINEIVDIAVAAIFGLACLENRTVDW
jgi:hypothetical protein